MDRLAADPLEDHRERRVRQDRPVRQDAEERDAVAGEAALEGPGEVRLRGEVDLVDDGPGDADAGALESAALSTISSIGRPTPPSDTMTAGAPSMAADDRVRQADDRPDPGVPGALDEQDVAVAANVAWAARMRAGRSSTTLPSMYAWVNPRGMWTGLICRSGSGRPKTVFISTASSSAGTPSSMTVRWPTGLMNPVDRPRRWNPSRTPEADRGLATVLAGRGQVQMCASVRPRVVRLRGLSLAWRRSCARPAPARRAGGRRSRRRPRPARGMGRAARGCR